MMACFEAKLPGPTWILWPSSIFKTLCSPDLSDSLTALIVRSRYNSLIWTRRAVPSSRVSAIEQGCRYGRQKQSLNAVVHNNPQDRHNRVCLVELVSSSRTWMSDEIG